MPFSSQPRKKGPPTPRGGPTPSCGHSVPDKSCPTCKKTRSPTNVIELNAEKNRIALLKDKVAEKVLRDEKGPEKAATILSWWISGKRK